MFRSLALSYFTSSGEFYELVHFHGFVLFWLRLK